MNKQELIEYLKENLSIEVITSSEYTGAIDGPMYEDCKQVLLKLDSVVISEAYL